MCCRADAQTRGAQWRPPAQSVARRTGRAKGRADAATRGVDDDVGVVVVDDDDDEARAESDAWTSKDVSSSTTARQADGAGWIRATRDDGAGHDG